MGAVLGGHHKENYKLTEINEGLPGGLRNSALNSVPVALL